MNSKIIRLYRKDEKLKKRLLNVQKCEKIYIIILVSGQKAFSPRPEAIKL